MIRRRARRSPPREAPAATTTIAPRDTPLETPPSTKVPTTEAPTAPTTIAPTVTVTVIIDGDTVEISTGERVRLVGIDTPERGTGNCASKATARLTELVLGHPVALVAGARDDEDRYGRLLRYVDAEVDAGHQLIVEGFAIVRLRQPATATAGTRVRTGVRRGRRALHPTA